MKKLLGGTVLALVTVIASAQWSDPVSDVPAYNVKSPSRPLPPIFAGQQLTGVNFTHPYQVTIYKMAARIPAVLHQQPCYCRCDLALRHKSLHSCFAGTHGASCSTCMKEAMFSYEQTAKGRTPAQIRSAIERGDWMSMDIEKAAL